VICTDYLLYLLEDGTVCDTDLYPVIFCIEIMTLALRYFKKCSDDHHLINTQDLI
jgi:hypothetical protein